jgi:hypothetical protein
MRALFSPDKHVVPEESGAQFSATVKTPFYFHRRRYKSVNGT